jgi:hypothetical protein
VEKFYAEEKICHRIFLRFSDKSPKMGLDVFFFGGQIISIWSKKLSRAGNTDEFGMQECGAILPYRHNHLNHAFHTQNSHTDPFPSPIYCMETRGFLLKASSDENAASKNMQSESIPQRKFRDLGNIKLREDDNQKISQIFIKLVFYFFSVQEYSRTKKSTSSMYIHSKNV